MIFFSFPLRFVCWICSQSYPMLFDVALIIKFTFWNSLLLLLLFIILFLSFILPSFSFSYALLFGSVNWLITAFDIVTSTRITTPIKWITNQKKKNKQNGKDSVVQKNLNWKKKKETESHDGVACDFCILVVFISVHSERKKNNAANHNTKCS